MSRSVVKGQTTDQLSFGCSSMLHLHDFNHVQIGLRRSLVDGEHSIDDIGGKLVCEGMVEFGGEGCTRNAEEEFSVNFFLELECIQEL